MGLVLLTGGARSGKSMLALRAAQESGRPVAFLATAEAGRDAEFTRRIARHRAERPAGWDLIEEPVELRRAIERAAPRACLIVDCLSLWVANLQERGLAEAEIVQAGARAATAAARRTAPTIAVSNEVGLGIVPASPLARRYRDLLGRVNAAWAEAADEAVLVVAGRAVRLDPWAGLP